MGWMGYLLVNFGGPRTLEEVPSFLTELLCDRDVIRTPWPAWLHRLCFTRIAKKRAAKISSDYARIGGRSPIFFDTEAMREALLKHLAAPVLSFHRYLPATHEASIAAIESCAAQTICVIPLFPQFCSATTGSVARFLDTRLSLPARHKLRWIRSYPDHPAFLAAWRQKIGTFLKEQHLSEKETILLFSAHGIPKKWIEEGDSYEQECRRSFCKIKEAFPDALGVLAYQSKFGRGEWLSPSTEEVCAAIEPQRLQRSAVVVVPVTFTSDHIETLFEIEELYLPLLRKRSIRAHRCPALNLDSEWIASLASIAREEDFVSTESLYKRGK